VAYNYITFGQAKQLLANRLYDETGVFWTAAERALYIREALRTWQALTSQWVADYTQTLNSSSANWLSLNVAGSPRQHTVTDADLYAIIQYHLLEPVVGASAWTGTPQFSLSDLTNAFSNRQNEILQATACNVQQLAPISLVANTRRAALADTILDVRRARFLPVVGAKATLWREDSAAWGFFASGYRQTSQTPRNYTCSAQPPLTLDVDYPPNVSGNLDLLAVTSGNNPSPPSGVLLSIPDDWSWVLKWGMLGDLFGKESEARNEQKMQYCNARFMEGLQLMQALPWVLGAEINNVPTGIEAVKERDMYDYGWEDSSTTRQSVIVAGVDLLSVANRPTGSTTLGLTLQVVQNAPLPNLDADPVQVSRDVLDVVLDYAFHIATFKESVKDIMDSMPLFDNFRKAASSMSAHLSQLGPFLDVMKSYGRREEEVEQR
jgi:hypothetical protein